MSENGLKATGALLLRVVLEDDKEATSEDSLEFHLDAPGVEGYIIGRSDAGSSYVPDVDLAPFEAQQRGISRRHAAIVRYRGGVHILDLGSMNGTFVNNERLSPQVVHALKDGDQLSLANLHMTVTESN